MVTMLGEECSKNALMSGYAHRRNSPGNDWRKGGHVFRTRDGVGCDRAGFDGTGLALHAAAQGIEHYFDPARHSQLVEDSEEIVLYGVLPEREPMRDLAVREAL